LFDNRILPLDACRLLSWCLFRLFFCILLLLTITRVPSLLLRLPLITWAIRVAVSHSGCTMITISWLCDSSLTGWCWQYHASTRMACCLLGNRGRRYCRWVGVGPLLLLVLVLQQGGLRLLQRRLCWLRGPAST